MPNIHLWNPVEAVPPLGKYSQIVEHADAGTIYFSGQVANNRAGHLVGPGDAAAQTRQVFENIGDLLSAAGEDWRSVLRLTTYLTNADDFPAFAETRAALFADLYMDEQYPAHTLMVVAGLSHPDHLVEVDTVVARRRADRG
jgi:2-iminobutanoate/2-iminopropanoate deaminase